MSFVFRLTTSYSKCKILASEERVKTRVKKFGIRNLKMFGIRNSKAWNPESNLRNPESTVWNPESATRLDSFTWGDVKEYKEVLSGQFMEKAPSSLLFVLFLFWFVCFVFGPIFWACVALRARHDHMNTLIPLT